MKRSIALTLLCLIIVVPATDGQTLFVGIETSSPPSTRTSDLSGFPAVSWTDGVAFEVSGAAATPDQLLYICNGAFTTRIYTAEIGTPPQYQCTAGVDLHALAYGRDTLWGYANFASPKGIYSIDPATGDATLVLDVYTGTGFRFFALDYNPVDDLLYGYTEYGTSGLYSIDIDTGDMIRLVGTIPASNGQGRGLAIGNNTVYLTATRGDENIPFFAYDLAQGPGGSWVAFTNAYPDHHATGGSAWVPAPTSGVNGDALERGGEPGNDGASGLRINWESIEPNPAAAAVGMRFSVARAGTVHLAVYDAGGRRVASLFNGVLAAGHHDLRWDGRDASGRLAPAGVYFARLVSARHAETRKIVLVP